MGILGMLGNLVRKFPARLHVFQSFVVTRAVDVRGRAVFLVLGPYARRPDSKSMGLAWIDFRNDAKRLLCQRCSASCAAARVVCPLHSRPSVSPMAKCLSLAS